MIVTMFALMAVVLAAALAIPPATVVCVVILIALAAVSEVERVRSGTRV